MSLKKEVVLVIDDDSRIGGLVEFHLEGVVGEVQFAETGETGISVATSTQPDLILLDIDMPGIDGFEVGRQLKHDVTTRDIPIIFLTGETETHRIAHALDSGATDYVTKPFEVIDLQARVRAALRTKRLVDMLRIQARLDPLTGLSNRGVLDDALAAQVAEQARHAPNFAFCLLDLDHFKAVNDSYGHAAGDEVLREVAQALKVNARPYDVVCRFGGEEFALLLRNSTGAGAKEAVGRMLQDIRQLKIAFGESRLSITASAGLVMVETCDESLTPERLLIAADHALYAAKESGRDQLVAATDTAVTEAAAIHAKRILSS